MLKDITSSDLHSLDANPELEEDQYTILQTYIDRLVRRFREDEIQIRIVVAGSRSKGYHLQHWSDFDLLLVYENGFPFHGHVKSDGITMENVIFDNQGQPLSAASFYNKTQLIVHEVSGTLADCTVVFHPRSQHQISLDLQSGKIKLECDILTAIPNPLIPGDNFFVPYGRSSDNWFLASVAQQKKIANTFATNYPGSTDLIRLLKYMKYSRDWKIRSMVLELCVWYFLVEHGDTWKLEPATNLKMILPYISQKLSQNVRIHCFKHPGGFNVPEPDAHQVIDEIKTIIDKNSS